jgi:hypothetical protein
VLHNTRLEEIDCDEHSNLLGQFISYEESEVVVNTTPGAIFTTFHFHCNLGLASDKHSNLLGPFISYEKMRYWKYI